MQLATAPVVGEPSKPGQTALSGVERQAGGLGMDGDPPAHEPVPPY